MLCMEVPEEDMEVQEETVVSLLSKNCHNCLSSLPKKIVSIASLLQNTQTSAIVFAT